MFRSELKSPLRLAPLPREVSNARNKSAELLPIAEAVNVSCKRDLGRWLIVVLGPPWPQLSPLERVPDIDTVGSRVINGGDGSTQGIVSRHETAGLLAVSSSSRLSPHNATSMVSSSFCQDTRAFRRLVSWKYQRPVSKIAVSESGPGSSRKYSRREPAGSPPDFRRPVKPQGVFGVCVTRSLSPPPGRHRR